MNKLAYQPIGFVLKFDPPIIGLLYHPIENKKLNKKKKKCYAIHLNNLIFLVEPEDIVEALFNEHQEFLDPDVVKPQQVYKLVLRLVAYRDHQLRNMQEMGEDMGDGYYEEEEEEAPAPQPKGKGARAEALQRKTNDNNRSF